MAPHRGMNFARAQLEKYGWTEGKGLGVNESGITEALKPKLKFDTSGIGHDAAEQFTYHWWENAYNEAAGNLEVCRNEDGVAVKVHDDSFDISTRKYLAKSSRTSSTLLYGNFLKTSTLTGDGHIVQECEEESSQPIKSVSAITLTDEELLKACGGLTAHKGARHGLTLSGKLSRIQEQEQKLLGSMKDKENAIEFFTGDDYSNEKDKKKRINKENAGIEDLAAVGSVEPKKKKKKKKNKEVGEHSESNVAGHVNNEDAPNVDESVRFEELATDGSIEPQRKKKKRKNKEVDKISESNGASHETNEDVSNVDESAGFDNLATAESIEPQRKKKKRNKVVGGELSESNIASHENNEAISDVDKSANIEDLATVGSTEHKKKRKKSKEASVNDENENMQASDVEEHRRKKYKELNESVDQNLSVDVDELTVKSHKKKKDPHSLNGVGTSSVSNIPEELGDTNKKFRKNEEQCTEMENETTASHNVSNNIDYPSHATKKRPPLTWRETPEGWICCRCAAVEDADLNNTLSNGDVHAPQKNKKKYNKDNVERSSMDKNIVDEPDSVFDGSSMFDEHNSEELSQSREGVDQTSKEEKKKKKKKYKQEVGNGEQTNGECHVDTTLEHPTEDSILGITNEVIDNSSKKRKQKQRHLENGDETNDVLENISGVSPKKDKKKKKSESENAAQDKTVS
ncbi:G patch domain-containing protein 4 [Anabrus simplex]|uniref:G patch domain-containing protein 4 n=1 Tax=Anabrus simplex TaxID=316456 RepID=UPI0035A35807